MKMVSGAPSSALPSIPTVAGNDEGSSHLADGASRGTKRGGNKQRGHPANGASRGNQWRGNQRDHPANCSSRANRQRGGKGRGNQFAGKLPANKRRGTKRRAYKHRANKHRANKRRATKHRATKRGGKLPANKRRGKLFRPVRQSPPTSTCLNPISQSALPWYADDMSLIHLERPVPDREVLRRKHSELHDSWEQVLFEIHRRIRNQLAKLDLLATVKYRVKSFESYYDKVTRRSRANLEQKTVEITDLLGIRIVCPFTDDLERVEHLLESEYTLTEREKKGAEFSFKEFGYESMHFLAEVPADLRESLGISDDTVIEIQLRTILQDAWAEVEHELVYKGEYTGFDDRLRRKLAALNANLSLADMIFHEIRVFQRDLQKHIKIRRKAFADLVRDPEDDSLAKLQQNQDPGTRSGDVNEVPGTVNPGDSLLLAALDAHNHHRYELAIKRYTQVLAEDSRDSVVPIAYIHRGMAYFSLGRYQEAHEDFDAAVRCGADLGRAYHYRGISHSRLGRDDEALKDFAASLAQDRFQVEVLMSRGQTHLRLGNLQDALRDCDDALKLAPDNEEVQRFRDQITSRLGM